ncbi:aminotransferase class IV [Conexibacter stalactiti]|uniref:Aminotransferase class IV n=1 Tax=Conexibacter stalactiti TaxID=1940611 RepID=A0ABU4HKJ9_9ACTN|nr:aminotransferase class IV [Conexibacter stalactiti]MDW5593075.1 aminotransferase class IV [Conexibacter stalactiti]MEC5033716.1 aminotransferase class IV [Conexibacter stalactiti]
MTTETQSTGSRQTAEATAGPGYAYVDGRYCPIDEAKMPLMDWGILRSDATYDVLKVNQLRFFRIDDHLARFRRSCDRLGFRLSETWPQVRAILGEVVARSGLETCAVYVIATRGVPPLGMSRDPRHARNRLYAMAVPMPVFVQPGEEDRALAATVGPKRRIDPSSVDPTIKNFHWQDLVQSLRDAQQQNADTTILLDMKGDVTEGPGFNVFIVENGKLLTPASGVLEGITRMTVIDIAHELNIPCAATTVTLSALRSADEIFGSSTAGGIIPLGVLDGAPVGDGRPGPLTRQMQEKLAEYQRSPRFTSSVDEVRGS